MIITIMIIGWVIVMRLKMMSKRTRDNLNMIQKYTNTTCTTIDMDTRRRIINECVEDIKQELEDKFTVVDGREV